MKILATLVVVLASLFLVAWRQSRAFEAAVALEAVRRDRSLAELERDDLLRRIDYLVSRSRVTREAGTQLGMHIPRDAEIVLLPADAR